MIHMLPEAVLQLGCCVCILYVYAFKVELPLLALGHVAKLADLPAPELQPVCILLLSSVGTSVTGMHVELSALGWCAPGNPCHGSAADMLCSLTCTCAQQEHRNTAVHVHTDHLQCCCCWKALRTGWSKSPRTHSMHGSTRNLTEGLNQQCEGWWGWVAFSLQPLGLVEVGRCCSLGATA